MKGLYKFLTIAIEPYKLPDSSLYERVEAFLIKDLYVKPVYAMVLAGYLTDFMIDYKKT